LKLTKNEKKTLKLLIENAKISDSAIAAKLKISSQAVGKIRKKLESTLIDSYTIHLNYSKLGIKTFSIALAKITPEGLDQGELEIEQKLLDNPHIIQVYRLPTGSSTHIILYGFKDTNEQDNFFHSLKNRQELHKFIENKDLFTFSNHSLIKNNPNQLFHKIIDSLESEDSGSELKEFESFKKKLEF
jgi:DNA-binding Lrp family transcriptional regulator